MAREANHRPAHRPYLTAWLCVALGVGHAVTLPLEKRSRAELEASLDALLSAREEDPAARVSRELAERTPGPLRVELGPVRDGPPTGAADRRIDDAVRELLERRDGLTSRRFGLIPDEPRLEAVFTSLLIHTGLPHVLFNLLLLAVGAAIIERRRSAGALAGVFAGASIAATAAVVLLSPDRQTPVIGASGVAVGLLGGALVLGATSGRILALLTVLGMIVTSFVLVDAPVAHEAHLGGGLGGLLTASILGLAFHLRDRRARTPRRATLPPDE